MGGVAGGANLTMRAGGKGEEDWVSDCCYCDFGADGFDVAGACGR